MPGAFGTADEAALQAAAQADPGTDGVDLVSQVTLRRAVHASATARPRTGRGLRLRDQDDDPAPPRRARRRSPSCRPTRRPPTSSPLKPDGVFLSNGPGDPAAAGSDRHRDHPQPARPGADLRDLPRPPAALARPRRPDLQAAVRPPRRQPPGAGPRRPARSRSPARTTTSRSTDELGRRRRPSHPRQPQRRDRRGPRAATTCRPSACSTTPRPAPAPTTAAISSTEFAELMDRRHGQPSELEA